MPGTWTVEILYVSANICLVFGMIHCDNCGGGGSGGDSKWSRVCISFTWNYVGDDGVRCIITGIS